MTRLSVRLTLLLACVSAIGVAAFLTWSSEQHARATEDAFRRFDVTARGTGLAVAELRAAQQAYVATGQGEDFWFARVSAVGKELNDRLFSLKSMATVPEAITAVDEAAMALQDFDRMDRRARDYARNHQLTLASDLVFTDGLDLTKKAGETVERALTAEALARDATIGGLRRQQAFTLAGAAGVAALGLLLLLPAGRKRPEASDVIAPALPESAPMALSTLDDLPDFTIVKDTPAATAAPAVPAAPPPASEGDVDLAGMAALCADLARIQDTHALPGLLDRAADLLQASGIVLWIADPDGRELSPIMVHGYSPQLSVRFGTIARDAENVTASAYRTGLLQTMKSDAVSNGAVAAPLVAAGGCVGVMAAEIKNGGERQESLLAAATIIASQLATLVGPPAVKAKAEAAG